MGMEYYFIDTVYDDEKQVTVYYVMHHKLDGSRVPVQRAFKTYKAAERLRDELNEDLYSEGMNEHG